ncbi:MAG: SAM-dependent methyltransferase [Hyphomicrobiales bacterium]|nr:SAM-dependent methyltransferase [Hyphomicrobiales bacterium]
MAQAPAHIVFDRALARRRLARALAARPAGFLLDHIAAEFPERLAAVLRPFPRVLDLGTPAPVLVAALAERAPELLVQAAPLPASLAGGGLGLVADEEALPFAPESFDLVVSALALQGVNDLPGTLVQIRRILRPDGLFLACLVGGQTLQELRVALAAAEEEISGGVSPRVAPFADLRDMGGLLQRAGFALPVTDADLLTVRYDHMFALMADLRAMGATNVLVARDRRPLRRAVLVRAAEIYQSRFADPDGRVRASFEFVWLSGWAPHESQQKPLQPGSAKARLADALSTVERKI